MIFLSPIWFTAIAAVLIPLAIHLWNIREGKTLRVGSILLMSQASRQSSRSLKLIDVLLLVLRGLMLILLAAMLAIPVWRSHPGNGKIKGWVIIPRRGFKQTYTHFKKTTDSLLALGFELRYPDADFTPTTLPQALQDTALPADEQPVNYWETAVSLNNSAPANLPVYLFTDNLLSHFNGSKPTVLAGLHWQTYTPADSVSQWIQKVWLTANGAVQVIKGSSTSRETLFTRYTVQPGQANALFNADMGAGGAAITLKGHTGQPAIADTSILRIAIVADKNQPDALYLNAALKAISPLLQHPVRITSYTDMAHLPPNANWLFLLSGKAPNIPLRGLAKTVFMYQPGKTVKVSTWLVANSGSPPVTGTIPLYSLVTADHDAGNTIWADGFGHPVLTYQANGGAELYKFYSRFNPAWTDLVWNDNFARLLLALMVNHGPQGQSAGFDKRVISNPQLSSAINNAAPVAPSGVMHEADLSHYFWLVLILLFCTERWLAHQKTSNLNG